MDDRFGVDGRRRPFGTVDNFMALALHHIGILVPDIAQAAGQYAARFGYRVYGEIVHDPVQTAYVQFLSLSGSIPFVELVTPDGPESKLSNALKKGGGLNHLCYISPAIGEECDRLRESGMLLLQSPVAAEAFPGRRIAWLMGRDGIPIELVEPGQGQL
jgi:methylmalonyl-CoA/ethylmalonyl-CoA epimerase